LVLALKKETWFTLFDMQATTVYYTATYPSSFPNAETSTTSTSAPASNTQPTDLNSPLGNGIKRKQVKNACSKYLIL
jgi:hypothetical protein